VESRPSARRDRSAIFATLVDPDGNQISLRQAGSPIGEDEGLVRRQRADALTRPAASTDE
jgi:hypothetical protein